MGESFGNGGILGNGGIPGIEGFGDEGTLGKKREFSIEGVLEGA